MTTFMSNIYDDWKALSIAVASISVLASVMLILLSRLFTLKELERTAKTELIYAVSTVLLVTMTLFFVQGENLLASNQGVSLAKCFYMASFKADCYRDKAFEIKLPAGQTNPTLIDWMKQYLSAPRECSGRLLDILYVFDIPIETLASEYHEVFMSDPQTGYVYKFFSERISNATQILSFYIYTDYLLEYTLNFVKNYAGFFFSIGVVLRTLPPTRGAGAYLMAISFGFYFIFPLSYILVSGLSLPHLQGTITSYATNGTYTCRLPTPVIDSTATYQCMSASFQASQSMRYTADANLDILQDLIQNRISDFANYLVSTICYFPLISFVVFMTFVLNATNLFGGAIPEIGRGLVKLI